MAKKKLMTPKKGMTIGRKFKTYKHGEVIPPELLDSIDKKYLEDFQPPKMTPKKGMFFKVGKTKYTPGMPIAPEHLDEINPQFIEPFVEPEPDKSSEKKDDKPPEG